MDTFAYHFAKKLNLDLSVSMLNRAVFICCLLLPVLAFAEETDRGVWNSLELQKKCNNGLSFSFEEEYRMRDGTSTTDRFMSTFEVAYKLVKYLKTGVSYTLIHYNHEGKKNKPDYWEQRHRYNLYVQGSYRLARFEFSLKERYQSTYRVGVEETETRANPKALLRSKWEVDYDVPRIPLTPYGYCEWQHSLNTPSGGNGLVETRYSTGVKYKVLDFLSVEGGYLLDLDKEDDVKIHALTLGAKYSF